MKKVLIVCAHRCNRSPSQRYRFEQYLGYLEQNRYSFEYSHLLDQRTDPIFYSPGRLLEKIKIMLNSVIRRRRDIKRLKDFDLVFEQRESLFLGSAFFEKAVKKIGKPLIFDFDDSIWLADTSPGNKKWEWLKQPEKIFEVFKVSSQIIAGNQYLANQALKYNQNVSIIPTTVDSDVHVPMPDLRGKQQVVLGWSGSISTIKHFNLIVPVLQKLKKKYGQKICFRIIADKTYTHPELEMESLIWSAEKEVEDLNGFDVGLMPLPDDEWSRGKCGLKGLSYMACGVATIMSSVGVNSEIITNHVNGVLADGETLWFNELCNLIENQSLRDKLGKAGRQTVVDKYSVQANREKYLKVFNDAQSA